MIEVKTLVNLNSQANSQGRKQGKKVNSQATKAVEMAPREAVKVSQTTLQRIPNVESPENQVQ